MRKLTALFLLLTMVVAMFAGCSPKAEAPTKTVEDAKDYLFAMYKDRNPKTLMDYTLVGVVTIAGVQYTVEWSTDAAETDVKIVPADKTVTIDINEKPELDVNYTLTATLKDKDGKTATTSFSFYIPGKPVKKGGASFIEGQPAVGTYKYALEQANLGKTLYFAGAMNGSYLATTDNALAATDVTIEEVEGGYRFFFMDGETKTYIDVHEYKEGKAGVRLTAEPTATFVWNEDCKVFTTNVAGADRYLGTYNTYNTISASETKYIAGEKQADVGVKQFPAGFCTVVIPMNAIEAPKAGDSALYYLEQANLGKTLYFNGKMNGSYLGTTENAGEAVEVTIEEVEGGVRFYFMDGATKTYIDVHEYKEGKAGVRLTAEPTATFTWNEDAKVYTALVAGAERYLGTYNTYNTISASDVKYIAGEKQADVGVSQFPAGFGTVAFTFAPAEGQPAAGTYKYALEQANLSKTLYFAGAMNGSYLATTENAAAATDVTIEEVEGGYRFYFMDGATKTYIDVHEYKEGKAGVRLTAEPTAVFTWNEECGVFTANVAGAERYLGTYNTYNTISASDVKYIAGEKLGDIGVSQFPAYFGNATL